MKKILIIYFFQIIALALTGQNIPVPGTAFIGVNIIDPGTKKIIKDQTVYIEQSFIKQVGKSSEVVLPNNAIRVEARGKYLMPGLAEMHAHTPVPDSTGDYTLLSQTLFLYFANGITTIRGMLGQPFHLAIKQELFMRNLSNATPDLMFTSSPSLNGNTVPDIATAERLVREYKSKGYHFLKIHPGIKRQVYDAIVRTAREVGIDFAGHVPVEVGIVHALESGQKTIDHLDGYIEAMAPPLADLNQNGFFGFNVTDQVDLKKLKSLVQLTRKSKAWLVPTQSLFTRWFSPEDPNKMINEKEISYMPARTRYSWLQSKTSLLKNELYTQDRYNRFLAIRKKILHAMYKGKVNLLLGSDAPQVMNVPGFSIHHEMKTWSEAGIPNWAILQAGTSSVARFFDVQSYSGSIASGKYANLILLDKNPVKDIQNINSISGVMATGKYYSKQMIEDRLLSIAKTNE